MEIYYNISLRHTIQDEPYTIPQEVFGPLAGTQSVSQACKQRPDIILIDFRNKKILLVEVGISCSSNLEAAEQDKHNQYATLEALITKARVFYVRGSP